MNNAQQSQPITHVPIRSDYQADNLALIGVVSAGVIATAGFLLRWMFVQIWTHNQAQFADLKTELKDIKEEVHDLQTKLPVEYVCREDFLRVIQGLEMKIDRFEDRFSRQIESGIDRLKIALEKSKQSE